MITINYYEILGISYNATQKEIRDAYRKEAKKWHPDVNPSPEAHHRMQLINEAYETLSDLKKRKEYDKTIIKNGSSVAYKTYTETRQESESDLEDWLKDFLRQRRKIDNLYKEYAKIISQINYFKNYNIGVAQEYLIKKALLELEIKKWFTQISSSKGNLFILEYLFLKVELCSKRAFNIDTEYGTIPADLEEKCLYEIYKVEFSRFIKIFSNKEKLIEFLITKIQKYAQMIGNDYDYVNPGVVKIYELLLSSINNTLDSYENSALETFKFLFEQFEAYINNLNMSIDQLDPDSKRSISSLALVIANFLAELSDKQDKDKILCYLLDKVIEKGEDSRYFFINHYIRILTRSYRKK